LSGTNARAYYKNSYLTTTKSFKTLAQGVDPIKRFLHFDKTYTNIGISNNLNSFYGFGPDVIATKHFSWLQWWEK
jgi:hypothetical protein